jgi:hypothetical protein
LCIFPELSYSDPKLTGVDVGMASDQLKWIAREGEQGCTHGELGERSCDLNTTSEGMMPIWEDDTSVRFEMNVCCSLCICHSVLSTHEFH